MQVMFVWESRCGQYVLLVREDDHRDLIALKERQVRALTAWFESNPDKETIDYRGTKPRVSNY